MWWASAGEKRTDQEEEDEYDSSLLASLGSHSPNMRRESEGVVDDGGGLGLEMAVIGYFHRLTALILRTLSEIVDASEGSSVHARRTAGGSRSQGTARGAEQLEEAVEISSDDMMKMGLDMWSESDHAFVEELVEFYWGKKARVHGGRVECCGVRVL